jgi:hypothetical protein
LCHCFIPRLFVSESWAFCHIVDKVCLLHYGMKVCADDSIHEGITPSHLSATPTLTSHRSPIIPSASARMKHTWWILPLTLTVIMSNCTWYLSLPPVLRGLSRKTCPIRTPLAPTKLGQSLKEALTNRILSRPDDSQSDASRYLHPSIVNFVYL